MTKPKGRSGPSRNPSTSSGTSCKSGTPSSKSRSALVQKKYRARKKAEAEAEPTTQAASTPAARTPVTTTPVTTTPTTTTPTSMSRTRVIRVEDPGPSGEYMTKDAQWKVGQRAKEAFLDGSPRRNFIKLSAITRSISGPNTLLKSSHTTPKARSLFHAIGESVIEVTQKVGELTGKRGCAYVEQARDNILTTISGSDMIRKNRCSEQARKALKTGKRKWYGAGKKRKQLLGQSDLSVLDRALPAPTASAVPADVKEMVSDFFASEGVSRVVPDLHRMVLIDKKTKQRLQNNKKNRRFGDLHAVQYMTLTLSKAFAVFKEKHPDFKYSQRCFEALRPRFVLTATNNMRARCCCLIHVGFSMKVDGLNACLKAGGKGSIGTMSEVLAGTFCPKEDGKPFAKLSCIFRECSECGVRLLDSMLPAGIDLESIATWRYYVSKKDPADETRTLLCLEETSQTLKDLIDVLKTTMDATFTAHCFKARWQQLQLQHMKDFRGQNEVLLEMDFSEAYTMITDQAAMSTYWTDKSINLHISVAERSLQPCDYPFIMDVEDSGELTVLEVFYHLSTSKSKTADVILDFTHDVMEKLKTRIPHNLNVKIITDGPSGQYKNRFVVVDTVMSEALYGVATEHHYHATSHAKGRQDGFGSVFKNLATSAVCREGALLNTPELLFEYTKELLGGDPSFKKRARGGILTYSHVYLKETVSTREARQNRLYSELAGIRKMHFVKGEDSSPNQTAADEVLKVEHAEWSPCQCGECFFGSEDDCAYKSWWPTCTFTTLHKENSRSGTQTKSLREKASIGMAGLVQAGSVVAIESGDSGNSFYLFRATGSLRALPEPEQLGGFLEGVGTLVIDGEWFGRVGKKERVFRLLDHKDTVTSNSVRYILPSDPFDLDHRGQMVLRESIHEEIMGCLEL